MRVGVVDVFQWSGHHYVSWRNMQPQREREEESGAGVEVDIPEVLDALTSAIRHVRDRRRTLWTDLLAAQHDIDRQGDAAATARV